MPSQTVTLKKPFDIKNLKPRFSQKSTPFSSCQDVTTYNVQTFGAVIYESDQLMKNLMKEYPDWKHTIYAGIATSALPKGSTEVYRLRFITSMKSLKNESHTNIVLLPAAAEPVKESIDEEEDIIIPKQEESEPEYTDVSSRRRTVRAQLPGGEEKDKNKPIFWGD